MTKDTKSQFYRWVFTLDVSKTFVTPEKVVSILTSLLVKNYVFQLEKGEVMQKPHYQGRFTLKTKRVKTSLLIMFRDAYRHKEISEAEAHEWLDSLTIRPEQDAQASEKYASKDETRIGGPWSYPQIYRGQDLFLNLPLDPRFRWQEELKRKWEFGMDSRSIYYIYDPAGNTGKSTFIKKFIWENADEAVILGTTFNQIALTSALIGLGPRKFYLADFPRTANKEVGSLLAVCEGLKNGMLVSSFYGKNNTLMMMPPLVCIFSNELPDWSYLSKDRWKVFEIKRGFNAEFTYLESREAI